MYSAMWLVTCAQVPNRCLVTSSLVTLPSLALSQNPFSSWVSHLLFLP
ncbi:mCG148369 [Mus musculus]|nr:mCG148369 [Mus musculus]